MDILTKEQLTKVATALSDAVERLAEKATTAAELESLAAAASVLIELYHS